MTAIAKLFLEQFYQKFNAYILFKLLATYFPKKSWICC